MATDSVPDPLDPISDRLDRTAEAINQLRTGGRVLDAEVLFAIATSNEINYRLLSAVLEIKDGFDDANLGTEERHRAITDRLDRIKLLLGDKQA